MPAIAALAYATSVFTITDNFDDAENVVIGGKTYIAKGTLGAVDGHFLIEATKTLANGKLTLANLANAINLGAGSGTKYAAETTANVLVYATYTTGDDHVHIYSRLPGTIGNQIPTTDTHGEGSWTSTVMASGSGNLQTALAQIESQSQLNADLITTLSKMYAHV
jgi:hypothetical protein